MPGVDPEDPTVQRLLALIVCAAEKSIEENLPYSCLGCGKSFEGDTAAKRVQAAFDHYGLPFIYAELTGSPEEQAEQAERIITEHFEKEELAKQRAAQSFFRIN